jgi:hypothetical protein
MSSFSFSVNPHLVLRKTAMERLKYRIRRFQHTLGMAPAGWAGGFGGVKGYLSADTDTSDLGLTGQALADVKRESENYIVKYTKDLEAIPVDQLKHTVQFQILPIVEELINRGLTHNRIADVGCCYVRINKTLIDKHPNVVWDMVDFPDSLHEINAGVLSPNMNLIADYPLDWLKATSTNYDAVLFNRTLAAMPVSEFRRYLRILKTRTSYVVFNEPGKILFLDNDLDIDSIDPACPLRMSIWNTHNYRKVFEEEGYEFVHYDAVRTTHHFSAPQHFVIQGIARPIGSSASI